MGGKLDFYKTPKCIFETPFFRKERLQNYDPKNIGGPFQKFKTIMTGGMSTEVGNTYVAMGQQCISRWRSTEEVSCRRSSEDYVMFGGASSPIPS